MSLRGGPASSTYLMPKKANWVQTTEAAQFHRAPISLEVTDLATWRNKPAGLAGFKSGEQICSRDY